jgi:hypothetical protein
LTWESHEGFVPSDDHHDEQVSHHHHVDQAEHDEHDVDFRQRSCRHHQMVKLLQKFEDVHPLGENQTNVQRGLQPTAAEQEGFEIVGNGMLLHEGSVG